MSDQENTNKAGERKLKPASENIWYALATIAGEPKSSGDGGIVDKNRFYWNGYMRIIIGEEEYKNLIERNENSFKLPKLKKIEIDLILETLVNRGFSPTYLSTEKIDFSGTNLPYVDFTGFVFANYADFSSTHFFSRTNFTEAFFLAWANFRCAVFNEWTDFNFTKFFSWPDFSGATFNSSLDFTNAKFLRFPPMFFNAIPPEDIVWSRTIFPDVKLEPRDVADYQKDIYERLGLMMDKLNKHHDQHMFFRLEMRARRQMETRWFPRFMNWAYEIFSDYGYDIERATKWWLGNILLGALLLIPYKGLKFDFRVSGFWEGLGLIGTALTTSFSNAHGFLGLGRGPLKETIAAYQSNSDLLIPYNVTATAQTILGVIFLFFVILTARNRFRMG